MIWDEKRDGRGDGAAAAAVVVVMDRDGDTNSSDRIDDRWINSSMKEMWVEFGFGGSMAMDGCGLFGGRAPARRSFLPAIFPRPPAILVQYLRPKIATSISNRSAD